MTKCRQPRQAPDTNGALARALQDTRAALESCAAKVDAIAICQQRKQPAND